MTAAAQPHKDEQPDINARITRNMDAIRVLRGMSGSELYTALGITRSTWGGRRHGDTAWLAWEIDAAARILGVGVGTLYAEDLLPHLDSNQKPADLGQRTNVVSLAEYTARRSIERPRYGQRARRRAAGSRPAAVHFLTVSGAM